MNKIYLRRAVAYVVGSRLILGAIAWIAVTYSPSPISYTVEKWHELQTPHDSWLWPFVAPWQQWDGLWLQHVSTVGYPVHGQ